MGKKRSERQELLPGTLDMLILKTLSRQVMHGYGIAEHIRQVSAEVLKVEEGSLYPALQRLQLQGLIASEWGHSANNRRARYYRLTAAREPPARRNGIELHPPDGGDRAGHEARLSPMDLLGNPLPLVRRIRAALTRRRLDDELREEIADHIERRRRELVDAGMDPRDAAFEARRMFGNATVIRERTRDMRSFRPLDSLTQDARFGARVLLRTPLFSAVAIMSLALGIGAAVAVFTVADAVLFRPLAVREPQDLRAFRIEMRMGASSKIVSGVPAESLPAIQQGADFADFIGFRLSDDVAAGVDGSGASQPTRVEFVSANYFDVLGVPAATGRLLGSQDDVSAPTPVVISEQLWRARFNQDPGVLGRTISLNGHPTVVVGVTRFRGLVAERASDVFAPLKASSIDPTQSNFVVMLVGRLRPGVSVAVAEQKLASLYRVSMPGPKGAELHATLEDASRGVSGARGALEKPLRLGLLLVAVLVLVACANTGGLLLSRFASRQGEFGVRLAIGAGRGRLARQLAVEAFVVSAAAGCIGLFLGWLAAPLFVAIMPETGSQAAFELRFDVRLVLFTFAVTVMCAGGAAAASLFRLWRSDPSALLNTESRTVATGSRRITRILIAAQVAASLLLVVGAVSMARTLVNLQRVPLGFDSDRTFVVTVNATGLAPASEMSAYHARLHERISAVPAWLVRRWRRSACSPPRQPLEPSTSRGSCRPATRIASRGCFSSDLITSRRSACGSSPDEA